MSVTKIVGGPLGFIVMCFGSSLQRDMLSLGTSGTEYLVIIGYCILDESAHTTSKKLWEESGEQRLSFGTQANTSNVQNRTK